MSKLSEYDASLYISFVSYIYPDKYRNPTYTHRMNMLDSDYYLYEEEYVGLFDMEVKPIRNNKSKYLLQYDIKSNYQFQIESDLPFEELENILKTYNIHEDYIKEKYKNEITILKDYHLSTNVKYILLNKYII